MSAFSRASATAVGRGYAAATQGVRVPEALTWLAFAGGVAWAVYFLVAARGVEGADPFAHFVISREAWHRPALILDHWGRPVDTLLYMPAALVGFWAARVTSLVLGVLTALVTLRLAHRLQVGPAFVVLVLFWFQPWSARWIVHPALSEIPFGLLMVLSAYLFVSGRLLPASLIIGLLPLTRIEAIALTGLWVLYCIWRREWRGVALAILPIVLYAGLYRWVLGQFPGGRYPIVPTSLHEAHSVVASGVHRPNWWIFVTSMLSGVGLPAVAFVLFSVPLMVRSASRLAVSGWYASYLAVHAVAFGLGLPDALGGDQIRYLFPLAPAVSIAGALGLQAFVAQMRDSLDELLGRRAPPHRLGWWVMAACILLVLAAGLRQKPTPPNPDFAAAAATASWLRQQGLTAGPLVAPHALIQYLLPGHIPLPRPGRDPEDLWAFPPPPSTMPVGTVVVWDSHFSEVFGLPYAALVSDPRHWRRLQTFEWSEGRLEVFRKEQP